MSEVASLGDHLGYWMRMVSNAVSRDFAQRVSGEGMIVAEWVLMRELYDVEAMAPSMLADRMGMTRGGVSKLVEKLLSKELIGRTDDPNDRRAHTLSLTQAGRQKVVALAAHADMNDEAYFGVLNKAEQAQLRQLLQALVARRRLTELPID